MLKNICSKILAVFLLMCLVMPAYLAIGPQSDEEAFAVLVGKLQMQPAELKNHLTLKGGPDEAIIELVPLRECPEHLNFMKRMRLFTPGSPDAEHMKLYATGKPTEEQAFMENYRGRLERLWGSQLAPQGMSFIVKINGEIAGFLGIGPLSASQAEVCLYLSPEHFNKGYTSFALQKGFFINLIKILVSKGVYRSCEKLYSDANPAHEHALYLYRTHGSKLGFVEQTGSLAKKHYGEMVAFVLPLK